MMMDPTQAAPDVLESEVHGDVPMPVTPSEGTQRLDGVAFDLPAGTKTPGMPTGDQSRATNEDSAQRSTESTEGPNTGVDFTGGTARSST